MGEVYRGTVLRWLGDKGFGFLRAADGGNLFVHENQLTDATALSVGQHVEYQVGTDKKGRTCAVSVKPLAR